MRNYGLGIIIACFLIGTSPLVLAQEDSETNVETEVEDDDFYNSPASGNMDELYDSEQVNPYLYVDEDEGTPFMFSGGLGMNEDIFSAVLNISYGFNRYVFLDTTFSYYKESASKLDATHYGPELALTLRGTNPTRFTPFAGSGMGYEMWKQNYDGVELDNNQSSTFVYFFGIDISLTKNFGFYVKRSYKQYLGEVPLQKTSPITSSKSNRNSNDTQAGFKVML